jgi:hypothetical protein
MTTITQQEYDDWLKSQVGKPCNKHGSPIKRGNYGNWCGNKDELGRWCAGNDYPHDGALTIKP